MSCTTLPMRILTGDFSIHRLLPQQAIPQEADSEYFSCVIKTGRETTLICPSRLKVDSEQTSPGWCVLQVVGPLEFELTGILAGIATTLANAKISIFALSSWETDYILVRTEHRERARLELEKCGYTFL